MPTMDQGLSKTHDWSPEMPQVPPRPPYRRRHRSLEADGGGITLYLGRYELAWSIEGGFEHYRTPPTVKRWGLLTAVRYRDAEPKPTGSAPVGPEPGTGWTRPVAPPRREDRPRGLPTKCAIVTHQDPVAYALHVLSGGLPTIPTPSGPPLHDHPADTVCGESCPVPPWRLHSFVNGLKESLNP